VEPQVNAATSVRRDHEEIGAVGQEEFANSGGSVEMIDLDL
jgi:hypothetical protein